MYPCRCQRGQSMIEYVVVCGVLVLVLGIGMVNQDSILWKLIDMFQQNYHNFSYAISLPT
ncbi:MAG: hypothetical protein H7234_00205 [Herminiimonas sp.]|nr:hypothetical protein [Herminiimonas sp.]